MSTMTDTYKTPEGFDLPKPLVFPDVRSFGELFTVDRVWDFATMNHRNGYPQPDTPEDLRRPAPLDDHKIVGRFLSARRLEGVPNLMVTPKPLLLDKVWQDESEGLDFAFFDRIGWEAIYHEANDRVLIVASASSIIASRWIAYVTPESVREAVSDTES